MISTVSSFRIKVKVYNYLYKLQQTYWLFYYPSCFDSVFMIRMSHGYSVLWFECICFNCLMITFSVFFYYHIYFEMAHQFVFLQLSHQTNKWQQSVIYIIIVLMLSAPPDVPEIAGYSNGSTVSIHDGTAITFVCRADHGDSPYRLTWTNGTHEIHDGTRSEWNVENGEFGEIPSMYYWLLY